ncbi:MAG: ORF6N domain-containing protein, partial [Acidobacteriota bacterium]|nr:ORF6N domain-containing protein [Acidobacteriota bacterium]
FLIRGERVMLDFDLATLYQVTTKALNQAVRRNRERFPEDFMFQLTREESKELNRSQIVTGLQKHRDQRFRLYAFTEQGVSMLSSVLRSKRAALVNVAIMRAFVKLRQILASNTELARKLEELEKKYDAQFKVVFDAIRQLMTPPEPKRKQIGFQAKSLKR